MNHHCVASKGRVQTCVYGQQELHKVVEVEPALVQDSVMVGNNMPPENACFNDIGMAPLYM